MSRASLLLNGDCDSVIEMLGGGVTKGPPEPTPDELRLALINAFGRIAALEYQVAGLRHTLKQQKGKR